MPSLLDIKSRIRAVENIKKITRAMQLVAAAKFHRSQNRARSTRPYSMELDAILGVLAAMSDDDLDARGESMLELSFAEGEAALRVERARFFEQTETRRPGIVLFTADRGLAGAFNTRLIRAASAFIDEHSGTEPKLITIGKKGHAHFKRRNVPIIHHAEGISDRLNLDAIRRITHQLVNLFVSDEVDALYFIYAKFRTAMRSDVTTEKFLSIPPATEQKTKGVYILEPSREAVYQSLIPLYATTKVFATLADSFASEYGARMIAMQLATKNAEEMLDAQVLLRNRLRQAIITKELAEIVGGAGDLS